MKTIYHTALAELGTVFDAVDESQIENAITAIAGAKKIAVYGVGREGLQMKGFAMRLFHLGLDVAVVGDMTVPHLGTGDLLIVSAGPGEFSTVKALMQVASRDGAKTLCFTAQPDGACPQMADHSVCIPAQTMANDTGGSVSVLPMGSLYEGAQYVLFEGMILRLRERLEVSPEAMRHNHTNLE
ncbi:SIS domain-containing protein [Sinorhizobium sp. BG8]|uniref:SIS domain-containing protein n=1 Tax=Sinorhizobium sp. BG8 TaxID=2613773 RepID=UPI00193D972F|nr:SIS domain-containing protein [Sinorhizobium sp. BG8]QRM57688.1 SIS domain-containing protein [Sinorhizobium sp. BG8]